MATQRYQNKKTNSDEILDDLYQKLNYGDTDIEDKLTLNLTNSIQSLAKRWLQEAYLDGLMLSDRLHRLNAANKNVLSGQPSDNQLVKNDSDNNQIALAVRQELSKLGLTNNLSSNSNSYNSGWQNTVVGLGLILAGFFLIGGAIGYYGLDTRISDFASQTYASLTASPNANNSNLSNSTISSNSVSNTSPITQVATAKTIESDAPTNLEVPSVSLSSPQANTQTLSTLPDQNSSQITNNSDQTSTSNSSPANTNGLPASCNGQKPMLNRPLNLQSPADRALMYCILDLEAQNQSLQQQTQLPSQTSDPNQNSSSNLPLPNPNQAPVK